MSATKVTRSVSTNRQVKEAMAAKKLSASDAGILAAPLSVEGIDDSDTDGHVPLDILRNGTRIVIPYWPSPLNNDELWISLFRNEVEQRLYTEFYSPPQPAFLYFRLTPQHLATDGVVFLSYKVWKGAGGIPDPSPERKLTINHAAPLLLKEPTFPHATLWGYLNNKTVPPLISGVTVAIPDSVSSALPGDIAKVHWQGYLSLNGSGPPVVNTYGAFDKRLQQQDIDKGYEQIIPFDPHIKPLPDNDSALVHWQLFRSGRLVGESQKGLVKIDRVTPGESGPFGLSTQGEMKMALQMLPPKPRPFSIGVKENGPFSTIAIDTLADNLIAKSVLDSGSLIVNLARTPDEDELDDLDVLVRVKGTTFGDPVGVVPLGPIADRPAGTIPISINAIHFPELPTPVEPTTYELMLKVYKGGGGIEDPSNIVEVVIDKVAPFDIKNPPRQVRPTPPPVFVNRPADAQVTVNEAFMMVNTNLNLTVNVGYPQRRLDDKVRVWLRAGTQSVEVWNDVVPATGAISFLSSVLRQFPNGRVNIVQQYEDLPGNQGLESAPVAFLTLALAQRPLANKAPLVPRTDPNYSTPLYLDDVAGGISAIVENAFLQHMETGDMIFVTIEDADDATNFVELPEQTWAGANLTFPLSYADLETVFADADEPKRIMIKHTITRTGMTPNVESPEAIFTLAFDYAGPTNPDLPDLVNRDMQLPTVTGASSTANSLLPGDRDKAGKFKVVFGLNDPPITPDQTAKCYINNVFITDYVPFTDEIEFEVTISAGIISALPTPEVQAHWTIQKSGIDKNVMISRNQAVAVGGIPIPLPLPTIRIRNPDNRDFIECFGMISPTSGYILGLLIPKDPLLPPGRIIKAHFEAHRNATGTDLIPGTIDAQDYTIKAADVPDVAPVGSPVIFKAAQPIRGAIAYGKYWYTTDINGMQSSEPVIKRLDTISNSFNYCDGTATPATAL
ncbi:hypothetical protein [Pseudomonas sp. NPDC099000]|uniref:hypothetical protein n=1 Tax=Pseudomonas sp. NPDC099000 TaxID=3364488 RepID=UPI003839E08F